MSSKKSLLEELKDSQSKAVVAFTEFTRMRDKYNTHLFCFVEGDDGKYYTIRVSSLTPFDTTHVFLKCSGKKEVIGLYKLLMKDKIYSKLKLAFFVDRDFDESIAGMKCNIYETPTYAIENFYTSLTVIEKILINECGLVEGEDYELIKTLFIERQKEFHVVVKLLNYWIYCQRKKELQTRGQRLNLKSFKLKNIIKSIDLKNIIYDQYDVEALNKQFKDASPVLKKEIDKVEEEINNKNAQQFYRGKYEIEFLYHFLMELKKELSKTSGTFKEKRNIKLNLSKSNIISELSQYANTPACLKEYLSKF